MDFIATEQELYDLTSQLRTLARQYYNTRKAYGEAKHGLHILLVPHQGEDGFKRASIDKQILNMLSITLDNHKEEVYAMYKDYIELEEKYKGLEKLIDATSSRIMAIQSLMRWERENT